MLLARLAQQKRVRMISPRWYWGLGVAAALIISIVAVPDFIRRAALPGIAAATATPSLAVSDSSAYSSDPAEIRSDTASDPESEGFMAVPFVPPLATGEMLRVVHTELKSGGAGRGLGVSVDPAWNTQLPADLLLGEDGMPRASEGIGC